MLLRLTVSTLALVAGLATVQAQTATPDAETLAVSQQLFETTFANGLVDKLVDQTWPATEAMIRQLAPQLPADKIARLKAVFADINREQITDTMKATPAIYAKYFSAAELRDMLAFYQTETGRKTLQVMPALAGELTQTAMTRLPDMMKRVQDAFLAALKEQGVTLPAGAAPR